MNKKGFTLVELLVTIAISTLVLSLGAILVNNIIDNSKEKTIALSHENIKRGANLFSKEFYDEIVWINNEGCTKESCISKSCISTEHLVSKGYLKQEEIKDATHDYIIIEKDETNTIISETTSDGANNICEAIIKKKVSPPNNKEICNDLEYNGTEQNLIKNNIGDIYKVAATSIRKGKNAGSYKVEIGLGNEYRWKDNSTGTKNVYCTIKRAIPNLTLSSNNQPAEKTVPTTTTITASVKGTLEIKSSNEEYATATSTPLVASGSNFKSTITIKNLANRKTNTYITITLIPDDKINYQSRTAIYIIGDITDIKTPQPATPTDFCKKNLYYNSLEQTLTNKNEKIGYSFYNNTAVEAGKYPVTIKLNHGFEWEDGSTDDIVFECEIKELTYKVHYLGNSYTKQTYNDSSQCNDEGKCGLSRYASGSKFNSTTGAFEHAKVYTYKEEFKLIYNRFTKTGYHFLGWALNGTGNVLYENQQKVSRLIDPINDPDGTIFKLYAKWEANTYTVNYNANGGTGTTSSSNHTYDVSKNLTANGFKRTGYTFQGWATTTTGSASYNDKQSVINLTTKNEGTIELYAVWKANTYTIKYNGNNNTGGSTTNSTHTYDTAKPLTTNGFKKTGYTFQGWATEATGAKVYTDKQSIKNLATEEGAIVNLYAVWKANTYTIKYNGNNNTGGSTTNSTHTYDTAKELTANGFKRTGYTFQGWATEATGAKVYTDKQSIKNLATEEGAIVNLYAVWTINTGIIYFYPNGGTALENWPLLTQTYGDGSYVGASSGVQAFDYNSTNLNINNVTSLFSRIGYHVSNDAMAWRVGSTTSTTYLNQASQNMSSYVANNNNVRLKVYANWTANTYTIKYNGNNNTGGSTENSIHTYDTAKNLTANGFTRTGYTFQGWATVATGTVVYADKQSIKNLTSTLGATINLYAVWKANTYTVKYDGNGSTSGSMSNSSHTYDTGSTLTVNGFKKTGYTFKNWNTKKDGTGTAYSNQATIKTLATSGTTTLYAQWSGTTYKVAYNANGGTGTMSPSTHTYGVASKLTANTFKKTGYSFAGWNTKADGTGTSYSNQASVSTLITNGTIKLYAKWIDNIKPVCSIKQTSTEWNPNGVNVTVTCSDSGSGCYTSTQSGKNLKSNKTYSIKDNAGNTNSCTVTITSRQRYSEGKYSVKDYTAKYSGTCTYSDYMPTYPTKTCTKTTIDDAESCAKKLCETTSEKDSTCTCKKVSTTPNYGTVWSGYTKTSCRENDTTECDGPQTQYNLDN